MGSVPQKRRDDLDRWERNRLHWEENVDAQNLGRSGSANLRLDLALYATADFREACAFLSPLKDQLILDLGGGLGLAAIFFARRGAHVIVADLSLPRLRAARDLAQQAGVAEQITFLQCSAEALPFRDGGLDRQFTKSVLIHTKLAATAAELDRTLAPDGKACFIEPFDNSPLVNLYRRLAAPGEWKDITRYFNREALAELLGGFSRETRRPSVRYRYLFAFLATPFNYILRMPKAYRAAEVMLLALDNALFALMPATRRWAWFGLIRIEPRRSADS